MMDSISNVKKVFDLYIKKYAYAITGVFLLLLFATVFGFVENLLNQYLLDEIVAVHRYEKLGYFVCIYVGINVVCLILSFVVGRQNLRISQKCSIDMRTDLMMRIYEKNMCKVNDWKSSEFVVRMMEDVTVVSGFFNNVIIGNATTVLTILLMMIYVFYYSWPIALAVCGLSILQVVVACLFSKPLKQNQEIIKEVTQDHMGQLNDNISNLPLIKSYLLGKYMLNHYKQILNSICKISLKNYNTEYFLSLCTTAIGILCDLFTIFIGVVGIKHNTITIGAFVVILNSVVTVRGLVMTLVSSSVYFQQFIVSLNRVLEIINIPEETLVLPGSPKETNTDDWVEHIERNSIYDITFRNVSFWYGEENVVLDGVDITLQRGRVNVLSGESGSGKSTLVALLLQLYYPTGGDILVNGRNLGEFGSLRDQVSVCFQTDYFLNGSVFENLKSVNPARSDEEIKKVLQLVEVDEFIGKLSDGLNSSIGEVSKNFSGGELKRISLARTLLKNAQIYVFDESFANIDIQMRTRIFDNIVTYLEDKMVIVITHDQTLTAGYDTVQITV